MDVMLDAATPSEWWMLAKAFWVFAGVCVLGMLMEGPLTSMYRRWQSFKDQEWRQVPPPNYRSSRGGREYW